MDVQEIEIIIDKDGQTQIQVRGVKGASCLDITRPLEDALGGAVTTREMTPEAIETAPEVIEEKLKAKRGR